MTRKRWLGISAALALLVSVTGYYVEKARAGVTCSLPFNLQNGTTADATQVMANYNALVTCLANAAAAGANNDITSLLGLTTPLSFTEGGSSVYIGGTTTFLSNVYSIASTTPSNFTLTQGFIVSFTVPLGGTNTGAAQLSIAGGADVNFFRQTPSGAVAMVGGELQPGQIAVAFYDGTEFQCINCPSAAQVPSGTTLDFSGIVIPTGFVAANGQALNRVTNSVLWNILAQTGLSATTNGTTTVTLPSGTGSLKPGWYVGASANIPCNSFIVSITDGTHFVINATATAGSPTVSIGPYQQGDCSTTFNVPNYNGKVLAGADGSTNITNATIANPATFTNGSPIIASQNNLVVGEAVQFTTTGSLPTNFAINTTYWVITTGLNNLQFEVSATPGGSAITAGSAGSGSQAVTAFVCPNASSIGDKQAVPNLGCGAQAGIINQAGLPNVTISVSSTNTNVPVNASSPTSVPTGGSATPLFGNTVTNLTSTGPLNGGVTQVFTPILSPTSLVTKIIKT